MDICVFDFDTTQVGNSFKGQKFFGNSPYGQFLFHGGKPGFLSSGGVRELDAVAASGNFYLLTYRLQRNSVEIKMNGQRWRPSAATGGGGNGDDAFAVRMSDNAALSLGNVKTICDTNAFQGRIAEVMIYDTILTDGRVNDVETYLQQKWWDKPFETTQPLAMVDGTTTTANIASTDHAALIKTESRETAATDRTQKVNTDEQQANEPLHDDADAHNGKTLSPANRSSPPPASETEPATFDPDNVFEWTPSKEHLTDKKESTTTTVDLAAAWRKNVQERIDAIRSFQFGGEVLRAFIRNRKDELLELRQELFG